MVLYTLIEAKGVVGPRICMVRSQIKIVELSLLGSKGIVKEHISLQAYGRDGFIVYERTSHLSNTKI